MVSVMLLQFQPPKSWQEFEALCHQLWRELWGDPYTQRNGRNGQPQAGVDIFGRPVYRSGIHGVQCKLKDLKTKAALSKGEIRAEQRNASTFQPPLAHFTIATTDSRHERLQEIARQISTE